METRAELERLQFLIGISTPRLLHLLARHGLPHSRAGMRHLGQLAFLSLCASACNLADAWRIGPAPRRIELPAAPVFIVGHWRTGSTWLHKLLSLDPALHAPTFFECCLPRGFLSGDWLKSRIRAKLPPHRPFDQAPFGVDEPFEDEFALAKETLLSPMLEAVFPQDGARYRGHLSLETLSPRERAAWEGALLDFAWRLSSMHRKRLLFKSPAHSFRVRELRALFPGAKFIALRRDPVEVIASTLKMEALLLKHNALQPSDGPDEDWIIRRYVMLQARLEEDWARLPEEDRAQLDYADLCRDPTATLAAVYAGLKLPDAPARRHALASYLALARPRPAQRQEVEREVRLRWLEHMESFGRDLAQETSGLMTVG